MACTGEPGRLRWLLAGAGLLLAAACSEEARRSPDFYLIVVDTMRGDALLDSAGELQYDTPNLDRLAADGVAFTRAFAPVPATLPSHTALFSSRDPLETGVLVNGEPVPEGLPLLAEWLGQHGYGSSAVLSLGTLASEQVPGLKRGFNSYDTDFWRIDRGERVLERFDRRVQTLDRSRPHFFFAHFSEPHEPYDAHGKGRRKVNVRLRGEPLATLSSSESEIWSQELTLLPGENAFELDSAHRFVVRALEARAGNRLLALRYDDLPRLEAGTSSRITVSLDQAEATSAHVWLWVNDAPKKEVFRERYVREVEVVDGLVGRLLDDLRATGRYDESLIVFTSDHGEALGERDWFGHRSDINDPQVHVPLIFKLPKGDGRLEALTRAKDRIVGHVDLVPTMLELLDLPPLPGARGSSLLAPDPRRPILLQVHTPEASQDVFALRDEQYKLVYTPADGRFQLFDVGEDPGETRDVFAEHRDARPDWPAQLEALARRKAEQRPDGAAIDPAKAAELESLGYGGGGDDD